MNLRKAGLPWKDVTVVKNVGRDNEQRITVGGHIQPDKGIFEVDAPIHEGDVVEVPDPRGGIQRHLAAEIKIWDLGTQADHMTVKWGALPTMLRHSLGKSQLRKIFLSHGRSEKWREVQAYIEKDLRVDTIELAQKANRGRTVLQKLWDEVRQYSFAVIVMTGDDDFGDGTWRARENVIHEIGFFQGMYGLDKVCLLYQQDTSIPSNIHGLVYLGFQDDIRVTFGDLMREIHALFESD